MSVKESQSCLALIWIANWIWNGRLLSNEFFSNIQFCESCVVCNISDSCISPSIFPYPVFWKSFWEHCLWLILTQFHITPLIIFQNWINLNVNLQSWVGWPIIPVFLGLQDTGLLLLQLEKSWAGHHVLATLLSNLAKFGSAPNIMSMYFCHLIT